jgi:hypothetical protein
MKVIAHQAISVNLPAGLRAGLRHGRQKPPAIPVIFKNCLPPVPTVQDVLDRPGILDVQLPSHDQTLKISTQRVKPIFHYY